MPIHPNIGNAATLTWENSAANVIVSKCTVVPRQKLEARDLHARSNATLIAQPALLLVLLKIRQVIRSQ